MGIRFFCPNGHKLNVKTFQAGERGVCPHCDARFTIPTESDPQAARKKKHRGETGNGAPAAAPSVTPAAVGSIDFSRPARSQTAPVATPQAAQGTVPQTVPVGQVVAPTAQVPVATTGAVRLASQVAQAAVLTPPAPITAPTPRITDPIAEAPNAIWYVRPPTGNQYGPARGDIMRKWIAEGRVSADSLVWREGWADWQTASQVLPSMAASAAAAPAVASSVAFGAAAPAVAVSELVTSPAATSRARVKTRTRPSTSLAIGIVVTLALLAVGLLVALVMVLQHTSK